MGVSLHVQAQQRLRIGGANVEPPIAVIDRDPIKGIAFAVRIALLQQFQTGWYVLDSQIDLARSEIGINVRNDIRKLLIFD